MKKFIFKAIFFIGFFFILDNIVYKGLFILNSKTDFLCNKVLVKKPDIIFFGDSKCRYGIKPDIISQKTGMSSYNIARSGNGILYSKGVESVILSYYRPKLFVIQVMSLSSEREALVSLAPYLDNRKVKKLFSYYPLRVTAKYYLFRTSRYNSMLLTMIHRLFANYDPNDGYVPLFGTSSMDKTKLSSEDSAGMPFSLSSGKNLLIEFIEEAKKNSVDMIMINMPAMKEEKDVSCEIYKSIAKIYNIEFFDFSVSKENKYMRLQGDYFWDEGHLNNNGAGVFSSMLGSEIVKFIKK